MRRENPVIYRTRPTAVPDKTPDAGPSKPDHTPVKGPSLPLKFVPRTYAEMDKARGWGREFARRVRAFRNAARAEQHSFVVDCLCHRAAFLSLVLETAEVDATEKGVLDANAWVVNTNALLGLMTRLGIRTTPPRTIKARAG